MNTIFTAASPITVHTWKQLTCPSMDDCTSKRAYWYNGILFVAILKRPFYWYAHGWMSEAFLTKRKDWKYHSRLFMWFIYRNLEKIKINVQWQETDGLPVVPVETGVGDWLKGAGENSLKCITFPSRLWCIYLMYSSMYI